MNFRVDAKANIRNRFDIVCRDIRSGEVQKYQAYNIVLDQMWSRLVNFQPFFEYIHFGTGDGSLSPTRTSLFSHLGTKAASTVSSQRALPTSYRQRRIILNPEEYVGQEITEVGVAYGSAENNLVTHAFLEDSEGNPISIVKTDTMVVTIYATIFFELGDLESMYGGKFRWVQPLANNELLSYLMGATYPTQQFRVTRAPEFSDGTAPASHGQSADIRVADWIKDATNKKVTTPVRRLGVSVGNGEIRGFGLGSSDTLGTFRGQFPIAGVYTGKAITETIGAGDGVETGFNLSWNDPQGLAIEVDEVPVSALDYDVLPVKKGTNLFLLREVQVLSQSPSAPSLLTDTGTTAGTTLPEGAIIGIDVGVAITVDTFRLHNRLSSHGGNNFEIYGTNNSDFSGGTLLGSLTGTIATGWNTASLSVSTPYRYYTVVVVASGNAGEAYTEFEILSADDQITFHTPPAAGAVITAEYTVPYIPKDSNHVLDLQVAIQYGEGS